MTGFTIVVAVLLLVVCAGQPAAAAACAKGAKSCWCSASGGTVVNAGRPPLLESCNLQYSWQGRQRVVRVFFPDGYDGSTRYPLWVHLHGVFWATMGGIGQQLGPLSAVDVVPSWDRLVEKLGSRAVIAYPQSTGYAGTGDASEGQGAKYRQFWNIAFWRCSVGVCADSTADDVGFLERVFNDLPRRLAIAPGKVMLTGESAGGMMVQALLCKSPSVARAVAAASDILGGIGKDFAYGPECAGAAPVPFLKLHGTADPFITYDRPILVDGVDFLSSLDAGRWRAVKNGCGANAAGPRQYTDQTECTNFCKNAPGRPPSVVCGVRGVAHTTDFPWPGFVYEQAWAFFSAMTGGGGGAFGGGKVMRAAALP